METLQSIIFIEFDVNTKKITFLRNDNIIDYDSDATSIYARVKYKNLSGNTVYLTPSELEDYKFSLYTMKPATNNVNVITGKVTDELKENVYGGVVKFEIPRVCTNRLGIVKCEIHINQGNKMIGSSTFVLDVKQSLVTAFDNELLGDEDFPVLKQLILEIQKDSNINDNNRSKITTYSSDKIEDIKEDLSSQINDLNSQIKEVENLKADKTTTNNIQQQVNNLVLGAVGDGNNAEVIQARGNYDVLNDRLDVYDDIIGLNSYMEKLTPTEYNHDCVKPDGSVVPVMPEFISLEFNIQNMSHIYVKNLETVNPNGIYCNYCILDANNEVLKVVNENNKILNGFISLPSNSSKIRFTCSNASYADGEVLVFINIKDVIDDKPSYKYVNDSVDKLDKLYEIDNLFDKNSNEVMKGYSLTGDGNSHENSNSFITNFIPVTANDTVYGRFIEAAYFVCYNAQKTMIGAGYIDARPEGVTLANLQNVSAEDLPTIAYIRFSNPLSLIDSMTITTTPSYRSREHKVLPVKNLKESNNRMINFWEGKIGDSLGDSLTEQGFFQRYTSMYFNLKSFSNHGVGGSKLSGADIDSSKPSMWQDSRINALRSDADFITILGGQNDGNVEIGEISKTNMDTNTYVGAYNTIIDKIYKKYNGNIKIILCTPFYVPDEGDDGERFIGLDKAVIEIGRLHGLPVADFGGMSGANKYTKDVYWGEDKTHPIEDFHRDRLAPILIDTMKKIEPIDYTKCNCITYERYQ